jgi:hypothetical protein
VSTQEGRADGEASHDPNKQTLRSDSTAASGKQLWADLVLVDDIADTHNVDTLIMGSLSGIDHIPEEQNTSRHMASPPHHQDSDRQETQAESSNILSRLTNRFARNSLSWLQPPARKHQPSSSTSPVAMRIAGTDNSHNEGGVESNFRHAHDTRASSTPAADSMGGASRRQYYAEHDHSNAGLRSVGKSLSRGTLEQMLSSNRAEPTIMQRDSDFIPQQFDALRRSPEDGDHTVTSDSDRQYVHGRGGGLGKPAMDSIKGAGHTHSAHDSGVYTDHSASARGHDASARVHDSSGRKSYDAPISDTHIGSARSQVANIDVVHGDRPRQGSHESSDSAAKQFSAQETAHKSIFKRQGGIHTDYEGADAQQHSAGTNFDQYDSGAHHAAATTHAATVARSNQDARADQRGQTDPNRHNSSTGAGILTLDIEAARDVNGDRDHAALTTSNVVADADERQGRSEEGSEASQAAQYHDEDVHHAPPERKPPSAQKRGLRRKDSDASNAQKRELRFVDEGDAGLNYQYIHGKIQQPNVDVGGYRTVENLKSAMKQKNDTETMSNDRCSSSKAILIKGRRAKSLLRNMEGRPLQFVVKEVSAYSQCVDHEIRIEALKDDTVIVTREPKSALHGKPMKLMHVEVCLCVRVRVCVCVYV